MASFTIIFVLAIYHNMGVMNGSVLSQDPGPEENMIRTYVIERVRDYIPSFLETNKTRLLSSQFSTNKFHWNYEFFN